MTGADDPTIGVRLDADEKAASAPKRGVMIEIPIIQDDKRLTGILGPKCPEPTAYWSPPSYVPMKRHPEGFTPSRVPMHGEGTVGWWSGLGHQLTCDRCGQSWAKRYAADARLSASGHECSGD